MIMSPAELLFRPRVRKLAQCVVYDLCVLRRPAREREEIVQLRVDLSQQLPWMGLAPQQGELRPCVRGEHARVTQAVKRRACLDARLLAILRDDSLLHRAHNGPEIVVAGPHEVIELVEGQCLGHAHT